MRSRRAEREEVGRARAGADEVDGHGLVAAHWTTGICARQPVKPPIGSAWAMAMRVSVPPRCARAATTTCSLSSVTALATSRPPGASAVPAGVEHPGARDAAADEDRRGRVEAGERLGRAAADHGQPVGHAEGEGVALDPVGARGVGLDRRSRGRSRSARSHSIADRAAARADVPQQRAGRRRERGERDRADVALGQLPVGLVGVVGQAGHERAQRSVADLDRHRVERVGGRVEALRGRLGDALAGRAELLEDDEARAAEAALGDDARERARPVRAGDVGDDPAAGLEHAGDDVRRARRRR